jgi:hypothetical protein
MRPAPFESISAVRAMDLTKRERLFLEEAARRFGYS